MRIATPVVLLAALFGAPNLQAQAEVTLGEGAQVYAATCSRCHNARGPGERSDREWGVIMLHMRIRGTLSGRETRAVLMFLQATNVAGSSADDAATEARAPLRAAIGSSTVPAAMVRDAARVSGPNVGAGVETAPEVTDTGSVEAGRKLIEANGCMACHKVGAFKTGTLGPDLNTVLSRRTGEWVLQKLADPKLDNAATVMPQQNLSTAEREAILAYLKSIAK